VHADRFARKFFFRVSGHCSAGKNIIFRVNNVYKQRLGFDSLKLLTCSPKILPSRQSADIHEEAVKENEQKLANLSPAAEATSKNDVEIERFFQEQKSKNTQYKSDLNAWKKFCESLKESRAIEDIPANEHLISVRKQNGTEYKPGTLSGFQRSFQLA